MAKNRNLNSARKAKNDEFYTRYEDIEKEMVHYGEYLKGKWVYSPCDDYRWSEFKNYFVTNFSKLGLSHYTCTNYDIGDGAWRYDYDGEKETITALKGDGDFRSEECTKIKDECDIVVTNPPFSLFRQFVEQIMTMGKKFIIVGNHSAITYKEIFPYLKDNKMWLGYKPLGGEMYFHITDGYKEEIVKTKKEGTGWVEIDGEIMAKVSQACWFTNCPVCRKPLVLTKTYDPEKYPKYDNYNAIEVSKVTDIPKDYDDAMGVPISFLGKYNPNQFEVIGITEKSEDMKSLYIEGNEKYDRPYLNGKKMYARLLIRKRPDNNIEKQ